MLTFGVTPNISDPERFYSKISKTDHFAIISPTVLDKLNLKGKKKNQKVLKFDLVSVSIMASVFDTVLFVGLIVVIHMLLGQERLYYKLSKTVCTSIFPPTVLKK